MVKFSETARERELCRYYQPIEPSNAEEPRGDDHPAAKSSSDTAITAFAQLSALRLNAARCIISLIGCKREYVLAEASKTLSLQDDTTHDNGDQLWHGEGALPTRTEIGAMLIKILTGGVHGPLEDAVSHIEVNDLREDERFKDLPIVISKPFARSLVCLPLRSARGYIIGFYCVIDDKPRENVSIVELRFLKDMATTVMDHIEAGRVRRRHDRAEKMLKALALFLEGGESLRQWWLNQAREGQSIQQSQINERTRRGHTFKQQADVAFGIQDGPDQYSMTSMKDLLNNTTLSEGTIPSQTFPVSHDKISENSEAVSVSISPDGTMAFSTSSNNLRPRATVSESSSVYTHATTATTVGTGGSRQSSPARSKSFGQSRNSLSGKELQEALFSADVKKAFSRASNLVREATDLDGVAFFDASIGSFGAGTTRNGMNQKAPGAHTFDSVPDTTSSGSDAQPAFRGDRDGRSADALASVLGYSTRTRSSLKDHANTEKLGLCPERLLRVLAKRYPHGKIFNFEDDGSISSSDNDVQPGTVLNATSTNLRTNSTRPCTDKELRTRRARRQLSREAEAAAILAVLPGVRSVAWFPLWDSASERWYAGSLIWSLSPTRVLIPEDELIYMAAWGNSLMAEVSRLSALIASQMKVDFVSSISHELRSPLHGILASVEFLKEEEDMPPMQADMINTISSCGKTLLDTIDHVLDFGKINKRKKSRYSKRRLENASPHSPENAETNVAEDIIDLSILTEEVIDSVYAGRILLKTSSQHNIFQQSIIVIVDISWQHDWVFKINAGAFRRILMNLFSNALKYTDAGFVKVSVTLEHEASTRNGKAGPVLHLIVSDSGKGISREFLREHLYTAFKQEDALSSGTGLGLSIVRQILYDVKGTIKMQSEQRSGTRATVTVPVKPVYRSSALPEVDIISEVRAGVKGKQVCIVNQGFIVYPEISDEPTGILSAEAEAMISLKYSLESMVTGWFDMEVVSSSHLDSRGAEVHLTLATDDIQERIRDMDKTSEFMSENASVVIVCCGSSYRGINFTTSRGIQVFFLRLPVFPHKLAKALHKAFCETKPTSSDSMMGTIDKPSESIGTLGTDDNSRLPSAQGVLPASRKIARRPALDRRKSSKVRRLKEEDSIDTPLRSIDLPPQLFNVLLVEDNEINLKLLTIYMSKLQQDQVAAVNGREALGAYKAASGKFDIVFMDLQMPVMDGLEATREIRRYENENGLPPTAVVALTGATSMSARQEAFSSGVDLFMTKPVAMKTLKDILLELRSSGRTALREFG